LPRFPFSSPVSEMYRLIDWLRHGRRQRRPPIMNVCCVDGWFLTTSAQLPHSLPSPVLLSRQLCSEWT